MLDAVANYRRIYPDLPGMGRTPAPENLTSADDVLAVLLAFIDGVIGDHPLLARIHDVPEHEAVSRSADIGNAEFRDYFTVQTPQTLDRYKRYVEPAAHLADQSALARIGERWELTRPPAEELPYRGPTLLVTGRQDSAVGYARAWELLEHYPRATFAVLDRSGHALPHEQPGLLGALVSEWLDRVPRAFLLMRQGAAR